MSTKLSGSHTASHPADGLLDSIFLALAATIVSLCAAFAGRLRARIDNPTVRRRITRFGGGAGERRDIHRRDGKRGLTRDGPGPVHGPAHSPADRTGARTFSPTAH